MGLKKEYVYVLTHIHTGKKYVGRSKDPVKRGLSHLQALMRGDHVNKAMQADFDKYHGLYDLAIVCEETGRRCDGFNSCEKKWMRKLKTYDERYGYNSQDTSMKAWRKRVLGTHQIEGEI